MYRLQASARRSAQQIMRRRRSNQGCGGRAETRSRGIRITAFAPTGWALCAGQLMPISQNTALFSLLGTMYGGNGISTFALPDLRGRVALGIGQGPGLSLYDQGEVGGDEIVTLLASEMPAHTHGVNVTSTVATADNPVGKHAAATPASMP